MVHSRRRRDLTTAAVVAILTYRDLENTKRYDATREGDERVCSVASPATLSTRTSCDLSLALRTSGQLVSIAGSAPRCPPRRTYREASASSPARSPHRNLDGLMVTATTATNHDDDDHKKGTGLVYPRLLSVNAAYTAPSPCPRATAAVVCRAPWS